MSYLQALILHWERRLGAWYRGERHIGKVGQQGRINVKGRGTPTIYARVYRAAEKKWYEIDGKGREVLGGSWWQGRCYRITHEEEHTFRVFRRVCGCGKRTR